MHKRHIRWALLALLLAVILLIGSSSLTLAAASPGDVVINEIMQNPSAVADSAGEWFELHNPTGADINIEGWTISDNGSDSHVINNGAPLLIPAGGFLVLGNNTDTATNGGVTVDYGYGGSWFIANGDDEIILTDELGTEIDRVEYDGGPSFPDPNGASMALINPALDNNIGANWCEAVTPYGAGDLGTPGTANDCPQTVAEIVINEIMQNPSAVSDSSGEWLELYNPGSSDVDINGWTIADNDFDSHTIANGGPLLVPAGGYLVLGNNTDFATNGGVNVSYQFSGIALANGADEVVLSDNAANEIDRVEYDGGPNFPDPNGASMALIDPALDNNVAANWCEAATPYGAGDLGTPGAANDCVGPTVELVINEIMQNPSAVSDSSGEWLELYNPGSSDVDINGWTIADNDFDSHTIANGGPLLVPAGGYLVLGNNDNVATNGGVNVAYDYGGSWFLSNSADEVVLLDSTLNEIDRVEYDGGPVFPDPTGASMSLVDPALDNNDGTNWCQSTTPFGDGDLGTPGEANTCDVVEPPLTCDSSGLTPIYTIQGSGASSPLDGTAVIIEGIVVGDFQENDGDHTDLGGFHLQDPVGDGDPATSDGIFVFAPGAIDVSVGDKVRVSGTVDEFFDMTEITNVDAVLVCGSGTVDPTPVTIPNDLEPYEGMLIELDQTLYISEFFNFDRFGEIVLTTDRQYQPTAIFDPGSPGQAALDAANDANRITLDDGRSSQNPDPAIHPNGMVFDLNNRFRGGDSLDNVTGVIDYRFGLYRIQPTQGADYTSLNPRPAAPDPVGGSLTVASFNVLNYFNGDGMGGGFPTSRGADDLEEFNRQRDKIMAAIVAMDADVIGLMEIENDGYDPFSAIADLVNGLNAATAPGTYAFIDPGVPVIGTDEIAVGLIYKPATVSPVGASAILDSSVDPRFNDDKNRPALAQSFLEHSTNGIFTVVVNHLKSKGSPCDDVGDPNLGDGAGNCNITRLLAAEAMVDWLATDPTGTGDQDVLIIGDLNSYDKEDPIDAILAGSDDTVGTGDDYTDLIFASEGELAYSFVFDGQLGYLDYALSNGSLTSQVTGTTVWHINADEPDILDYDTTFKQDAQDALYEPNAYRASDHDPVIVGLDLNGSPFCGDAYPSATNLWPVNHSFVDISVLGVTDPEGEAIAIVVNSIFQDEAVDAPGSGNTAPDGMGVGTDTAQVRAERAGNGNGRVYHIFFTAYDVHGNSCSGELLVTVPKSQGANGAAIDDGALYDSTLIP